ncbi:MAG TPA: M23 family metallopeptidase [Polyangiaceae bacterium]|nr:M23 family metallopeptidase [Polyangiaceae bacterium]
MPAPSSLLTVAVIFGVGTGVPSLRTTITDLESSEAWAPGGPRCLPLEDPDELETQEGLELEPAPLVTLDGALADLGADPSGFEGCELTLDGTWPESWARELWQGLPPARVVQNGHTEKSGRWIAYDQIPRRPERPDSYLAYRYPVEGAQVVSGYDLGEPDGDQRRGTMSAVGHGGIDLAARRGTPIRLLRLEHQIGDAEVLYVGWLFGETVVTRHRVLEGAALHDYLLLFGHLDGVGDDVRRGQRVREGGLVGFVGNSGSQEFVHLHLEIRRVRDGANPRTLTGDALRAREFSIVSDPRNLLPLRSALQPAIGCQLRPVTRRPRYWLDETMGLRLE